MYRISPFTPLFFSPSTEMYGAKSKYVQTFAPTDHILIEVISEGELYAPEMSIRNLIDDTTVSVTFGSWIMNNNETMYFHTVSSLQSSYYEIIINGLVSEVFKVTNDKSELDGTTLIQYSMKDNKQRTDGVWWIDGMQYFFDFRVPGGFKDMGWGFGVTNEQFVTSDEDIVELYSHEYTTKTFTLGNAIGCPVWFAELLNRVLCCNYIYFNGVRYVRKEGSVPELSQQIEGLKSFVFSQLLQEVKQLDPIAENRNQFCIRRISDVKYRHSPDNGVNKPLII